ncbi:hypothetical protein GCM10008949_39910 [Deinococcus humi]|nr:hypothetical protein GCM10008949_39910 [Deinococcus humi]
MLRTESGSGPCVDADAVEVSLSFSDQHAGDITDETIADPAWTQDLSRLENQPVKGLRPVKDELGGRHTPS